MIAIVGDAMLDIDVHLERVKTMDGVDVYREISRTERPGGSFNVAAMCRSLGRRTISLSHGTSKKVRYFCESKYLHRIDDDHLTRSNEATANSWRHTIARHEPNIILVCDHAKGVITKPVMDMLKSTDAEIYVDPCLKSDWSLFSGVNCISANREEWEAAPSDSELLSSMSIHRMDRDGVSWNGQHLDSVCEFPVDTVGAGDQFISVLACMRESGYSWFDAIKMSNIAAGLQCERRGIVPVTWNEMYERMFATQVA